MKDKKIFRSNEDRIIAGICSGLGEYFEIDSSLIRILFILLFIGGGSGFLIYILLWMVIPMKKEIGIKKELKGLAKDLKNKAGLMAKDVQTNIRIQRAKRMSILGILLILTGLVIIWNQFAPITIQWEFVWPALLIITGILLIVRR
jgi:phage shock protein C